MPVVVRRYIRETDEEERKVADYSEKEIYDAISKVRDTERDIIIFDELRALLNYAMNFGDLKGKDRNFFIDASLEIIFNGNVPSDKKKPSVFKIDPLFWYYYLNGVVGKSRNREKIDKIRSIVLSIFKESEELL